MKPLSSPRVSIIIPVYNGSNYLRKAIDSALAQTYNNIEVIVVNDGSSDDGATEEIAKSYGNRIRYFTKNNGGVASALNMGIKEMTGEYFAWLSHDDLFSPNRCEKDMMMINKKPDIKVIFCNLATMDAGGNLIKKIERTIDKVNNPKDVLTLGGVGMCTLTIHKSCFENVGMFNEDNLITQDTEMALKLSKEFTFYHNNNAITYSREHPQRGTHLFKEQRKKDCLSLSQFIEQNFKVEDFFPEMDKSDKTGTSNNFVWLGDFHRYLGAYNIADKYYRASVSDWKLLASKAGIKYVLGARIVGILNSLYYGGVAKLKSFYG